MTTTRRGKIGAVALLLLFAAATQTFGQIPLQFTDIRATEEHAIRLAWQSESNTLYHIECADVLVDPDTGLTPWRFLYGDYPSHGTNTFWLDTGNYYLEPSIVPHPKNSPMRFYRVVNDGTNSGPAPFVQIISITNDSVLSDQVTVSVVATSSLPDIRILLYVDGQEMDHSEDGTNFVINTCEWPNGAHTLFATATALSSFGGPSGSFPITIGRAASPYVQVTFDNLISKVAFSEPFFEPSLGQTQQVTAAFAANVDWTLQIIDENSNAVRTVTGSGTSLSFDWDGTGDGGTNIADGVYNYVISAQTNGMAFVSSIDSGDGAPDDDLVETWAVPADGGGDPVPFNIYPPDADTNNLVIFEASRSEIYPPQASLSVSSATSSAIGSGSFGPSAASGASSQSTTAPTRPPTAPVKNMVNNYGVAFFTWKTPQTNNIPKNGQPPPITGVVHLDGCSTCNQSISDSLEGHAENTAAGLVQRMKKLGWKSLRT